MSGPSPEQRALVGTVQVVLTPSLRQLALAHVYETEQGEELDRLVELFQPQVTRDGYLLDAFDGPDDAAMIVVIARALLWRYE